MKTDEERCIEYNVPYDPSITRRAVYERCRWKCSICGKRVSPRRKYPHPKSASLDHIVPLSWRQDSPGHVWGNVTLAHLVCNQRKGARWAGTPTSNRRPISGKNKLRMVLFTALAVAFIGKANVLVLTGLLALCILSVMKRKPSRRRAWWKL